MPFESDHAAESVTAVAGEGGVAVSYVPAGSRISPRAVVLLAILGADLQHRRTVHPQDRSSPRLADRVLALARGVRQPVAVDHLARAREPAARRDQDRAAGLGGSGGVLPSSISMVVALTKTSVAIVLVIFALSPLAAAVMAWILIGERVRTYTWIAIATTVAGVAFMVSGPGSGGSTTGALIALSFRWPSVTAR